MSINELEESVLLITLMSEPAEMFMPTMLEVRVLFCMVEKLALFSLIPVPEDMLTLQ